MVILENWSIVYLKTDLKKPLEIRNRYLSGFLGSEKIMTSAIDSVSGNVVNTENGRSYVLGNPDPLYVKWCQENSIHVPTKEMPIV